MSAEPKINEEQVATAKKENVGHRFDYQVFTATPSHDLPVKKGEEPKPRPQAFIEAERWIDARNFACRLFGCAEVKAVPTHSTDKPMPRYQVQQYGMAMGGDSIRLQYRQITFNSGADPKWTDVREL